VKVFPALILAASTISGGSSAYSQTDPWIRCLKESYAFQVQKLLEKNAAAEAAFGACRSEEEAVKASMQAKGANTSLLPIMKAHMKRSLIEGKL
jgi:hypothetical protein